VKKFYLDLLLRFLLGGSAVVICYILSILLPWKAFAGIFAAFPAVMIAAVSMAGWQNGSQAAANVASGAVCGMWGCLTCVLTALFLMIYLHCWQFALLLALVVWFISSSFYFHLGNKRSS